MKLKVLCLLITTMILASCSAITEDTVSQPAQLGNTNGNILNRGVSLYNLIEESVIMVNPVGSFLYSINHDTRETHILAEKDFSLQPDDYQNSYASFSYLNAYENYVYYIDGEKEYIHRYDFDTEESETISEMTTSSLLIADGKLYYTRMDDGEFNVYASDADGSDEDFLVTAHSQNINFEHGELFYYADLAVHAFNIKTEEIRTAHKGLTDKFIVYDGDVYAVDLNNRLVSQGHVILENYSGLFNISNDKLYFWEYVEGGNKPIVGDGEMEKNYGWISSVELDGTNVQSLLEEDTSLIGVTNDGYYCVVKDSYVYAHPGEIPSSPCFAFIGENPFNEAEPSPTPKNSLPYNDKFDGDPLGLAGTVWTPTSLMDDGEEKIDTLSTYALMSYHFHQNGFVSQPELSEKMLPWWMEGDSVCIDDSGFILKGKITDDVMVFETGMGSLYFMKYSEL